MTFRAILLIAPAACLIAVGNLAHVDPAPQTALFGADQHRAVGPERRFVVTSTSDTTGPPQIVMSNTIALLTAATGVALPTRGLFFGGAAVPKKVVVAIRRAAIPDDTPGQRMAALDK
jgi:hypothetical protein